MSNEKQSYNSQSKSHNSSSKFTPHSELRGKTAIVTGPNRGIGLECARQLLDRGLSKLVLAVRDERKGESAKQDLLSGRNGELPIIEVWPLDYNSYESITSFAHRANDLENLDIVVLNAGVYRIPCVIVPETGHEESVQVNYLSTALLAILLLPVLQAKRRPGGKPGRLTMVSSSIANMSRLKPRGDRGAILASIDEKANAKKFDHHQQYCTSKLLGQLFLKELAHRVPSSVAIVNCVNPGLCYGSGLARDSNGTFNGFVARVLFRICGRSCARGAREIVDGAIRHNEEVHGRYMDAGKPTRFARGFDTPEGKLMAEKLWGEMINEFSFAGVEGVMQGLEPDDVVS